MASQHTGSKGLVGDAGSLLLMGQILARCLLYHIDKTYQALRSRFFEYVNANHICFGYLKHRSQCCNSSQGDSMPMSATEYQPNPDIPTRRHYEGGKSFTADEALTGALNEKTNQRKPSI